MIAADPSAAPDGEERPSDDADPPTLEIRPARPGTTSRPAPLRRPRNALGPFVPELASWPT
jgi:hypothetical protein